MLPWASSKCILVTLLVIWSLFGAMEALSLFDDDSHEKDDDDHKKFSFYDIFNIGKTIHKLKETNDDFFNDIKKYSLGGGTAIVHDAIHHNTFEIGPNIRKWLKKWMDDAIKKTSLALVEGTFSMIWNIIYYAGKAIASLMWIIIDAKKDAVWNSLYIIATVLTSTLAGQTYNSPVYYGNNPAYYANKPVYHAGRNLLSNDHQTPSNDLIGTSLTHLYSQDLMDCVPLVLCAIHADPEELVSSVESKFKKAFRSLFTEDFQPVWAHEYSEAADRGKSLNSSTDCQATYSSCSQSAEKLRQLIFPEIRE